MTTRFGSSSSLPLIAVVLVGGLGIAGYRMMSGDCSSCSPDTNTAATTVAAGESSCCADLNKAGSVMAAQTETSSSCCSDEGESGVVLASETEDCCAGDTFTEGEPCCEDPSACEESEASAQTVAETEQVCSENCTKPCCAG